MSISSIGSGFTQAYAALQKANEEKTLQEQANIISQENTSGQSSGMGTDIRSLLSQVPKGDDKTLSFQDVEDYRENLGKQWDILVMADLEALGVDITKEMPMSYDMDTGKVTVAEGNADKATIDKYFEDNPDMVSQFYDIVQLGKLTATADSKLSQGQMMQNIQLESLAWWYEDNQDVQSWFDGGGMLALKGQSASYTGLNLKV